MLVNEEQKAAGYHVAIWEGRDRNGSVAASGVYVYQIQAGSLTMTKKMALVK
jgi:flagellar hook assembly protein FlgD